MKSRILVLLTITLALASCGGEDPAKQLEALKAKRTELDKRIAELEKEVAALDTTVEEGTLVTIGYAEQRTFKRPVEIQGVVESEENVLVSSEVAGKIVNLHVKAGDRVTKGQTIATIDNSNLVNSLQEIQTRLELAKTTYERQEKLYKDKNIGSEIQYLQAKNNYEALKNQKESLASQVAKFTITAPVTGTIDMVYVNEGENAMPGLSIARVVNVDNVKVTADISEAYIDVLKKGDSVWINYPVLGVKAQNVVSASGQYIDPANRTFNVTIKTNNANKNLKPNMLALVTFYDYVKENAIVIPNKIILFDGGSPYVYVVEDGVARKREIELDITYNGYTLVKSGLTTDDKIVVQGYRNIQEGEKITEKK